MRKNVWIWNHYATNTFIDQGGRHYWFAENLIKNGYNPMIFCASTVHNSDKEIDCKGKKYIVDNINRIPYVFIKTPKYKGNGKKRINNIITFYKNLFNISNECFYQYGKPDVILASSVHPLTLVAGIKVAKKFGIPCICEVRDLWPESMVAYGILKKDSIITKILYKGEKWIYKKANAIIMTWEGGKDYIIQRGWDNVIDTKKIFHISNGVDLKIFDYNAVNFQINDKDLDSKDKIKIVYTGSIRKVNNLGLILDVAKKIENKNVEFLIYGDGDERVALMQRCEDEYIKNVTFKGKVEKKYIPSILKKANINLLHNTSTSLDKYGQSQNKFFEYLAAGRCIIQTYDTGYSICNKYKCGFSVKNQTIDEIADVITYVINNKKYVGVGENARQAAKDFDFERLTEKLIHVIEKIKFIKVKEGEEDELV